jgi:hypothetical protein
MRVYVPDKKENVINQVLQELYTLKKTIDYGAGTPDSKIKMIDNVRDKLKTLLREWKELD